MNSSFLVLLTVLFFCFHSFSQKIVDVDGNSYLMIKAQKNQWMAENLRVQHFRNGEPIPQAQSTNAWIDANNNKKPAWCYYEDENGIDQKTILYNWYAVIDKRGLAPHGTHIPSYIEWSQLIIELGGIYSTAKKIKSNSGWDSEQELIKDGFNSFNAKPVGSRYQMLDASFNWFDGKSKGKYTNFWSNTSISDDYNSEYAHRIGLAHNYNEVINDKESGFYMTGILNHKGNGYSVRCIIDVLP